MRYVYVVRIYSAADGFCVPTSFWIFLFVCKIKYQKEK